jgi:LacI family transcriptional regulator
MVIVDRYLPEVKLPYVSSDNFKGAYQAVKYLLERGHRQIACVQGRTASLPNQERVRGYRQALQEYQVAVDELLLVGNDFGLENGYIKTKLLLRQEKKFSAIMALSNLICLGTIRALTEEGMEIPRDISLIGFDDQVYCEYLRTPVTTVAQNEKEIGSIATKLLIEWIQQGNKPGSEGLLIPTRLVERASVQSVNPV